jgi:hypothetical protein
VNSVSAAKHFTSILDEVKSPFLIHRTYLDFHNGQLVPYPKIVSLSPAFSYQVNFRECMGIGKNKSG